MTTTKTFSFVIISVLALLFIFAGGAASAASARAQMMIPDGTTMLSAIWSDPTDSTDFAVRLCFVLFCNPDADVAVVSITPVADMPSSYGNVSFYFRDAHPAEDRFTSSSLVQSVAWAAAGRFNQQGLYNLTWTTPEAPPMPAGWEYRVVNTTISTAGGPFTMGRIEVKPAGATQFGTVCNDGFTEQSAIMLCVALGYPRSEVVAHFATWALLDNSNNVSASTGPIYVDDLSCPPSASSLADCSFVYSTPTWPRHNCRHSEDTAISCVAPPAVDTRGWKYRLVAADGRSDASVTAGRLEILPAGDMAWGTVCDDNFQFDEATAACHSLGFQVQFGIPLGNGVPGADSSPIYLTDVSCDTLPAGIQNNLTSPKLQDCLFALSTPYSKQTTTMCFHWEDVSIDCSGVMPTYSDPYILYTAIVNTSMYSLPASLMMLGNYLLVDGNARIQVVGTPLGGVPAPGLITVSFMFTDPRLQDLPTYKTRAYLDNSLTFVNRRSLRSLAGIVRLWNNASVDPPAQLEAQWSYSLATGAQGIVAVRPSPLSRWGTINTNMLDSAANQVCHSLGYADATAAQRSYAFQDSLAKINASRVPIYVSALQCTPSELYIDNCSYEFFGNDGYGLASHLADLAVNCYPSGIPTDKWSVTLVNTMFGGTTGRLSVVPWPGAPAGSVCDDNFDDTAALAFCHSAGFTTLTRARFLKYYDGGASNDAPIYVDDVSCSPGATNIGTQCQFRFSSPTAVRHNCLQYESVGVQCREPNTPDSSLFQLQLLTPVGDSRINNTASGLLQFRPNGTAPWGTICASGSDATMRELIPNVAMAACRQLGYSPSFAIGIPGMGGAGRGSPIYLSQLNCSASATTLGECQRTFSDPLDNPYNDCSHASDLGVDCSGVTPASSEPTVTFTVTVLTSNYFGASNFSLRIANYIWGSSRGLSEATSRVQVVSATPLASNISVTEVVWRFLDPAPALFHFDYSRLDLDVFMSYLTSQRKYTLWGFLSFTSDSQREYRPAGLTARLLGPLNASGIGMLQVRPDTMSPWGSVCGYTFWKNEAVAACHSLGFFPTNVKYVQVTSTTGDTTAPIYLENVRCPDYEGTLVANPPNFLPNCSYAFGNSNETSQVFQCSHDEDVALDCGVVAWQWQMNKYKGDSSVGTLMAKPPGYTVFGTVCGMLDNPSEWSRPFGDREALAACRQLGYMHLKSASVVYMLPSATLDTTPIAVKNVRCIDNASGMDDCTWNYNQEQDGSVWGCSHGNDVAVDCTSTDPALWVLQVVQGENEPLLPAGQTQPTRGLLRFRPSSSDPWGTVCSRGFTDLDAVFACRAAGFNVDTAYALLNYGGGNGTVYLNNVVCSEDSQTLGNCSYSFLTAASRYTPCSHAMDVGLDCSGKPRPQDPIIAFTATLATSDSDKLIENINEYFGTNMASSGRVAILSNATNGTSGWNLVTFRFTDGDTSDASQNSRSDLDFLLMQTSPAQLYMYMKIVALTSNVSSAVKQTMQVRLVGPNAASGIGVVQIRADGNSPWGTVCDDNIRGAAVTPASKLALKNALLSICHSAGFWPTNPTLLPTSQLPAQSGYILLDEVACSSADYLQNCSFVYSPPDLQLPLHDCSHNEDLALACQDPTPAPVPTLPPFEFKLQPAAGGPASAGLLLARPKGGSAGADWSGAGTVCGVVFSGPAATAICRSMGFDTPRASWSLDMSNSGAGRSVVLSGVSCDGVDVNAISAANSAGLQNCSFTDTYTGWCTQSEDVELDCGAPPPWFVRILPSNASRPRKGLVQVKPFETSEWGFACSWSSSDTAARAICNSAGFPTPYAVAIEYYGGGVGPAYIDSLKCGLGDAFFSNCSFTTDVAGTKSLCKSWTALGVDCRTTPEDPLPPLMFTATTKSSVEMFQHDLGWWYFIDENRIQVISNVTSTDPNAPAGSQDISFVFTEPAGDTSNSLTRSNLEYYMLQTSTRTLSNYLSISKLVNNATTAVQQTMQFRLFNGTSPTNGLLQARENDDSDWGTVCDDGIGINEEYALCRSLGFANPIPTRYSGAGGSGNIIIDDMSCPNATGNSNVDFKACTFAYSPPSAPTGSRHNCRHYEDTYLHCMDDYVYSLGTNAGDPAGVGAILIKRFNTAPQGVCYNYYKELSLSAKQAVCAALGYPNSPHPRLIVGYRYNNNNGGSSMGSSGYDLSCPENTADVGGCTVTAAGSGCANQLLSIDCRPPPEWSYLLDPIDTSGQLRGVINVLINGDTSGQRYLVCPFFDDIDALVLCRQLVPTLQNAYALPNYGSTTNLPFLLADVVCTNASIGALSLCDYTMSLPSMPLTGRCRQYEATAVDCSGVARAPNPIITFTASYAASSDSARPASAFVSDVANVFFVPEYRVKAVGTPSFDSGVMTVMFQFTDNSTAASYESRSSLEFQLLQTTRSLLLQQLVAISISSDVADIIRPTMQLRIQPAPGSNNASRGWLQVKPMETDTWGFVCDDSFGQDAAVAACASLGYTDASRVSIVKNTSGLPSQSGHIYLDDVFCPGGATNFSRDCNFVYASPSVETSLHNCKHYEDVAIDCAAPTPPPPPQWTFKLAPGAEAANGGRRGLLLATNPTTGVTGTVCGFTFDATAARRACASLGFTDSRGEYIYGFKYTAPAGEQSQSSYPIVAGRVSCLKADPTTTTLNFCDISGTYADWCQHFDDVGIDCSLPPDWKVSIAPVNQARPYQGTLVVNPGISNMSGDGKPSPDGFVCSYQVDDQVARAACNSAGYASAASNKAVALEWFGGGVGPAYLDSVHCNINDQFLSNCSYKTKPLGENAYDLCKSWAALGVDCSGAGRTDGAYPIGFTAYSTFNASVMTRRMELWYMTEQGRFVVTSSAMNATGNVYQTSFYVSAPPNPSVGLSRGDLEYYLLQVSSSTLRDQLGIMQLRSNESDTVSRTMQVRLINTTTNVASGLTRGLIQVRPDASSDWGTVCDDGIEYKELVTLCKLAGVADPNPAMIGSITDPSFQGKGFIYIDQLQCPVGASDLASCTFTYSAPLAATTYHNCKHYEDVAVDCKVPLPPKWTFSFAPGSTSLGGRQGLLLATNPDTGFTGTVCGLGWNDNIALRACRSMGFTDIKAARYMYGFQSPAGNSNYPMELGYITCKNLPPTSTLLTDCSLTDQYLSFCTQYDVIGLDCSPPPEWSVKIVPANPANPSRGKVAISLPLTTTDCDDVYNNEGTCVADSGCVWNTARGACDSRYGPSGFICSYLVDDLAANAICAEAGFPTNNAVAIEWYGGGAGIAYMDRLRCGVNDTFDQCSYTLDRSGSKALCKSDQGLGVDCSGVGRTTAGVIAFTAVTSLNTTTLPERLANWFFVDASRFVISGSSLQQQQQWTVINFTVSEQSPSDNFGMSRTDLEYYLLQTSLYTLQNQLEIQSLTNNATSSVSRSMQVRLVNLTTGAISGLTSGMIQVRPDDNADWGTVCDDKIGYNELTTLCKLAGVANPMPTGYAAEGEGFIYIDELQCPDTASSLSQCTFTYSQALSTATTHDCRHREDVAVDCYGAVPPPQLVWPLSFAPGSTTNNGQRGLLLATNPATGTTGTVCGLGWDNDMALRACHSLGFTMLKRAQWVYGFSEGNVNDNYNITMGYIKCTSADTSYLSNCSISDKYVEFCSHADDVGLDCSPPPTWNVTIAPASPARPTRGRVVVTPSFNVGCARHTNNITACLDQSKCIYDFLASTCSDTLFVPGFICSSVVDDSAAAVLCRDAGFTGIAANTATLIPFYGGGFFPQKGYLSDVHCGANDTTLSNCAFQLELNGRFGQCQSWAALGLDCSGSGPAALPNLLFTVTTYRTPLDFRAAMAQWFFVPESRIAIQSVTTNATRWNTISFTITETSTSDSLALSRTDLEYYVLQTTPNVYATYLDVYGLTSNATTAVAQSMQVRLVDLASGTTSGLTRGLIQVRPDDNADWGTVCDDNIGYNELTTLCKLAGVANPIPVAMMGEGEGFIYIDQLQCPAGASDLSACSFTYTPPLSASQRHNCRHNEDVAVNCQAPTPPPTPEVPALWNFSLAPGTISQGGRVGLLLATNPATGATGTVCGWTFSATAALAACKSLGFPELTRATFIYGFQSPVAAKYSIVVGQVGCSGNTGPYLENCTLSDRWASWCSLNDVVGVECTLPPVWNVQINAPNAARPYRGKVVVTPAPPAGGSPQAPAAPGFMCSYGIDDQVARAVCTSAKFPATASNDAIAIEYYGGGVGPAYLDSVHCGVNDTTLSNCSYTSDMDGTKNLCRSWAALGVDCGSVRGPSPILAFTAVTRDNATVMTGKLAWWFFVDQSRFVVGSSTENATGWFTSTFTASDPDASSFFSLSRTDLEYYLLQMTSYARDSVGIVSLTNNATTTVSGTMQVRLFNYTTGMQQAVSGIVQVRPDDNSDWGTVCDDSVGHEEMATLCRIVGVAAPTPSKFSAEGEGFIYIDELKCSAGATSLAGCQYTYSPALSATPMHNCRHYEDLAVDCNSPTEPPTTLSPPTTTTVPVPWTFAFAPGATASKGLLLATNPVTGVTGTVCGMTFSDDLALRACRSLGFTNLKRAQWTYGYSASGNNANYPIAVGRIDCSTATWLTLESCSVSNQFANWCAHRDDVGVDCSAPPLWDVKVSAPNPARPYLGKVVVTPAPPAGGSPQAPAAPGFICSWAIDDTVAGAVCRSAGLNPDNASAIEWYGGGVGVAYMANLHCGPTDLYLSNCSATFDLDGSSHFCQSYDALGVDCSGTGRADAPIIMFIAVTTDNATVMTGKLAEWMFADQSRFIVGSSTQNATGWFTSTFTISDLDALGFGMSRTDLEYYLLQMGSFALQSLNIAWLGNNATATVSGTMQVRLVNLTTGATNGLAQGLIQVRPDDNSNWGTVCDDNIGYNELTTLCKLAGVANPTPASFKSEGEGFIYIDQLQCPPGAASLAGCQYIYSPGLSTSTMHNCRHSEDLAVDCLSSAATTPAPSTPPTGATRYTYAFAPGNTSRRGLLLVTDTQNAVAGTFCGFTFTDSDAAKVCNSMGLPTARATMMYGFQAGSSNANYPILLSSLDCPVNAPDASFCKPNGQFVAACTHADDVGIDCAPPPTWKVRISAPNAAMPYQGMVQLQPNLTAPWGFACSFQVDDQAARVLCKDAGFPNAGAGSALLNWGGGWSQPAYMDNIRCDPSSNTINDCGYTDNRDGDVVTSPTGDGGGALCLSQDALGLDCSGTPRATTAPVLFSATTKRDSVSLASTLADYFFTDANRFNVISSASNGTVPWILVAFTITDSSEPFALGRTDLEYYLLQTSVDALRDVVGVYQLVNNATTQIAQTLQVRLFDRTTGNTSPAITSGLVQVRPSSSANWGAVCDDEITANELVVLCKMAGVENPFNPYLIEGEGQGFIYVDDLQCQPNAVNLGGCNFKYSPPLADVTFHNCKHNEDVAVVCIESTITTTSSTTVAPTRAPSTTVAPTRAPSTTIAPTRAPSTTVAPTRAPSTTIAPGTPTPSVSGSSTPEPSATPVPTTAVPPSPPPPPPTTGAPPLFTETLSSTTAAPGSVAHVKGDNTGQPCSTQDTLQASVSTKFPGCAVSNYKCDSASGKTTFDMTPSDCGARIESLPSDEQKKLFGVSGLSSTTDGPTSPTGGPSSSSSSNNMPIIIGAAAGGTFLLLAIIGFLIYRKRKNDSKNSRNNQRFVDQDYVAMMDYNPPDV